MISARFGGCLGQNKKMDPKRQRTNKQRQATFGAGGLLQYRADLGSESFSGSADDSIWVTLPEKVRPVMRRAVDKHKTLAADASNVSAGSPLDIDELQGMLKELREERGKAEDAFKDEPDEPEVEKHKRLVWAFFDCIHELAYCKLLERKSSALAKRASKEVKDFLDVSHAGLEDAINRRNNETDVDGEEGAALPAFIRPGRLGEIQSGDAPESNKFTELLLYVQFSLRSRDLRRHEDRVYKRVINSKGNPTAAWRDDGDITQFVYFVCRKEINPRMWAIVAQPSEPVAALVRYFTTSCDPEFPELRRDKSVFSFDNGVYLAEDNEFLSYDDQASPFNTSHPLYCGEKVPGKHFEVPFPVDEHAKTVADPEYWKKIDTPAVKKLFKDQGIEQEAIDMMYVTVGRLMFDVGHDSYGYVGMIVGAAGTGKSTFCMHLTKLWEADDVGVLSNNCERQFALYPFMDKFLFVAPEVKSDFKLDQAEWQGITTGDPMSCAVKFKAARAVRWKTPGFFAGNQIPNWVDHGGSVLRRLLIWRFDKRVDKEEGNLPDEMETELPRFILKSAAGYGQVFRKHGKAALWNWVDGPEKNGYFWRQRRQLTSQLNPLESFINDKLVKGPDALMPFDEFKQGLRDFCKENGFENYKIAGDTFTTIFSDHGLSKGPRLYRGHTSQARLLDCVSGCRMRTEQDNVVASGSGAEDEEMAQDSCDES